MADEPTTPVGTGEEPTTPPEAGLEAPVTPVEPQEEPSIEIKNDDGVVVKKITAKEYRELEQSFTRVSQEKSTLEKQTPQQPQVPQLSPEEMADKLRAWQNDDPVGYQYYIIQQATLNARNIQLPQFKSMAIANNPDYKDYEKDIDKAMAKNPNLADGLVAEFPDMYGQFAGNPCEVIYQFLSAPKKMREYQILKNKELKQTKSFGAASSAGDKVSASAKTTVQLTEAEKDTAHQMFATLPPKEAEAKYMRGK